MLSFALVSGLHAEEKDVKLPEVVVKSIDKINWIESNTNDKFSELEKVNEKLSADNEKLSKEIASLEEKQKKNRRNTCSNK